MMASEALPFGQTCITTTELRPHVDVATATDALTSSGVENARERIRSVLGVIPELLDWLSDHGREYPWRYTTDPWHVFITEILLQRTRADAVAEIYDTFFSSFPTPDAVREADEAVIREVVHSLGFVNHRIRTLREAADLCVLDNEGQVPADLDALQRPWRVGPYTARACLLFAFQRPVALVDTNTARIVERVFGYPLPEQPHKSEAVYRFLDALVPNEPALARAFNLALLDLGALRCTSSDPDCDSCPLQSGCLVGSGGDIPGCQ
jgi:A/G-specific adenine glycosylase